MQAGYLGSHTAVVLMMAGHEFIIWIISENQAPKPLS
jgi:UDP-glucose 4-epimerase